MHHLGIMLSSLYSLTYLFLKARSRDSIVRWVSERWNDLAKVIEQGQDLRLSDFNTSVLTTPLHSTSLNSFSLSNVLHQHVLRIYSKIDDINESTFHGSEDSLNSQALDISSISSMSSDFKCTVIGSLILQLLTSILLMTFVVEYFF